MRVGRGLQKGAFPGRSTPALGYEAMFPPTLYLVETREAPHLVMAAIALDTAPQGMKGQVVDRLCENDLARVPKPSPD